MHRPVIELDVKFAVVDETGSGSRRHGERSEFKVPVPGPVEEMPFVGAPSQNQHENVVIRRRERAIITHRPRRILECADALMHLHVKTLTKGKKSWRFQLLGRPLV
jgi:hypothetical protein